MELVVLGVDVVVATGGGTTTTFVEVLILVEGGGEDDEDEDEDLVVTVAVGDNNGCSGYVYACSLLVAERELANVRGMLTTHVQAFVARNAAPSSRVVRTARQTIVTAAR
jgi:hypothetical protein